MAARIGIIGGSGLYGIEGLQDVREERVQTPFGDPSDAYMIGRLGEVELVFLPRHGRGHRFSPTEVPYRANLYGMKALGAGWVVAFTAVGSLREEIRPGEVVIIDQLIDRTRHRVSTFFDRGIAAHVPFGDPMCGALRGYLLQAASRAGAVVHDGGTYVCMEGPAFSTRAESEMYRSMGASVIGMTNLPEAKLAREAELSYATVALVTDYDCWHPDHDHVTVDQVVAVMSDNTALARRVISEVVPLVAAHPGEPPMAHALKHAIMTRPEAVEPEHRAALDLLVRKYL